MAYHLRRLSGSGLVKTRRCGMRRFVFQSGLFGEKQEVMLGVLMMPTPREILLCILESPGITQKALALRLKLSPPTIWWHTDRLARLGVISRRRTGRTIVYSVIATPGEILEFVRHYQPSAWEKWADRLHDTAIILSANHSEETVG
jgi:predicted transcriptional regulator